MGAAQSIPVVGEAITVVDSAGRAVAAGVTYPFNKEASEKLIDSAGETWKTYSERSAITANIRLAAAKLCDDEDECERLKKTQAEAWTAVGENTPVVGHVIGVVHYIEGDQQGGDRCMIGATRTAVVVGATIATGGAGAVAAGAATVGSGLLFDSAVTGIQSLEADKFKPSGYIESASRAIETGDARDIYTIISSPIEDFASGAMAGRVRVKATRRAAITAIRGTAGGSAVAADLAQAEGEHTLSFIIREDGDGALLGSPPDAPDGYNLRRRPSRPIDPPIHEDEDGALLEPAPDAPDGYNLRRRPPRPIDPPMQRRAGPPVLPPGVPEFDEMGNRLIYLYEEDTPDAVENARYAVETGGQPWRLTYDPDPIRVAARRAQSTGRFQSQRELFQLSQEERAGRTGTTGQFDRDEYPPAIAREGGQGAYVANIEAGDNRRAGNLIGRQFAYYGMQPNDNLCLFD